MANKTISIFDIDSNLNQAHEVLLIASILEKQFNKICVFDLNTYDNKYNLFNLKTCKEKDGIYSTKVFDRCNYIFPSVEALMGLKMNKTLSSIQSRNDVLLINPNYIKWDSNAQYIEASNEIVVFADITKDVQTRLVNFFLMHKVGKKKVFVFLYNYESNIPNDKKYYSIIKRLKQDNIIFNTLKDIPDFKSLDEISNVDPWEDIYKKINGTL